MSLCCGPSDSDSNHSLALINTKEWILTETPCPLSPSPCSMLDPLLASFRSDFPAKQTRFIVFVNDYLNDESFLTTTRRSVMSRIISNQASNHFLRWREATNMSTMIPPSPKRLWRKGTSKRAIGPDVSPKKGRLWRRKCAEKPKSSINKPQGIDILTSLPHEVLLSILSFLSVLEVDECAKLVCESLR